jgi:hypothetical protein
MIKIQEHLDRVDAEEFLEELASQLWIHLNPTHAHRPNEYNNSSLIAICKYYRNQIYNFPETYTEEHGCNFPEVTLHQNFFEYLLADDCANLKRLILAKPEDFDILIEEISLIIPLDIFCYEKGGKLVQSAFGKTCSEKIFNYNKFRQGDFCKWMLRELNIHGATCPYCNWDDIEIVDITDASSIKTIERAYLDLDHFYFKSLYPFFSVSFFNLIPSCHKCNSSDKGQKPFTIATHMHPYYQAFHAFYRFTVTPKVQIDLANAKVDIVNLGLKIGDITLDDLKLRERYGAVNKEAVELIDLFNKYQHYIGTADEEYFYDMIFRANSVPRERKLILGVKKGKMKYDLLLEMDHGQQLRLI